MEVVSVGREIKSVFKKKRKLKKTKKTPPKPSQSPFIGNVHRRAIGVL